MKNKYVKISVVLVCLIIINSLSSKLHHRFDLTEDQRYTLSDVTKNIIKNIDETVVVKVYLEGDFPTEFKRLQIETKSYLEELKSLNSNIKFKFINPSNIGNKLIAQGLNPSRLQIQENGKLSEVVIFPWAIIQFGSKTENVSLLKDNYSNTQNEQLESSIQNLEYAFSDALHKVVSTKEKKIAIIKGNGELQDIYIADFLKKIGEYYKLAPFTLDLVASEPQKTLKELAEFDLAIIAKPTEKFSEEEKFTIDQFIMQGGKSLWLIDNVFAELDSLQKTGESLVYPRDLGLTDLFFNYGIRINSDLIKDSYCSQIPVATGNIGNKTQFSLFPWEYFPLSNSLNNHPINNNIQVVNFRFPSSIDTLKNPIKKTILLKSSDISKSQSVPQLISLNSITSQPNLNEYKFGNKPFSVLLEGEFKSAYSGRIKPYNIQNPFEKGKDSKMVVISDGDLIANEIIKGQPTELGLDKWTNNLYGNKEFLLNCVNFLLDDSGLVNIRSKTVNINFLNKEKAYSQSKKWQIINIIFPLILLAVFGLIFTYFRNKKYR